MSKEKQIEEMALELCRPRNIVKMIHHRTCDNCDTSSCDIYELCVDLYNAGYRKQSEDVTVTNVGCKSEWISVEERLPNEDDEVLIYSSYYHRIRVGAHLPSYIKYCNNSDRITHWMPLPEAPKGGAVNE